MKKKILFVINTLGQAGAEVALIELLKVLKPEEYDIYLYVLLGQGELFDDVPFYVNVLNKKYKTISVWSIPGKLNLMKTVLKCALRKGTVFRRLPYFVRNMVSMIKKGKVFSEKLLWRIVAEGTSVFDDEFDLAVAYLEGGSAYYVAECVKARVKAAFIHVNYEQAGYTRELDLGAYQRFDRIFTVSDEVRKSFEDMYPELRENVRVFHNILDVKNIHKKAKMSGGFEDDFKGIRLLTVGRLTWQKAFDVAIDAMALLKKEYPHVRWYVLGEGSEREVLERKIEKLNLENDFILLGAADNPFPYYVQTDIYVHATRFEGKSIAIQEAQTLGCAIIASDCSGNREQIADHEDGILCDFNASAIKNAILELIMHPEMRENLGKAASEKKLVFMEDLQMLFELM